jgi:acetylornithine deacetylase/succinyl-diaminopimelate desuccinylase-like protein
MPHGSICSPAGRRPVTRPSARSGADLRRGDELGLQRRQWLANNKRDLIDAEFALNEGGGGRTDGHGTVIQQSLHVGEKFAINYQIVATNPGGHSSIPIRDNAIYEMADAVLKVRDYEFPLMLSDTTKAYFGKLGASRTDAMGAAMRTIASAPIGSAEFKAAEKVLNTDRSFHSMLRTTCVATLVEGGHANNALPQQATANINCRVFPGVSVESVQEKLKEIMADPRLTITMEKMRGPSPRRRRLPRRSWGRWSG